MIDFADLLIDFADLSDWLFRMIYNVALPRSHISPPTAKLPENTYDVLAGELPWEAPDSGGEKTLPVAVLIRFS
ncbi:hypothetical protein [Magnetospirillum molischianum]|uniref:hypothetical protein n=1 Tax=Magnetospirillum molischianum TaxID=1083 RepID=UPI0012DE5F9F|nr:hypothetical protein [Magnetospirillum molischianum]